MPKPKAMTKSTGSAKAGTNKLAASLRGFPKVDAGSSPYSMAKTKKAKKK